MGCSWYPTWLAAFDDPNDIKKDDTRWISEEKGWETKIRIREEKKHYRIKAKWRKLKIQNYNHRTSRKVILKSLGSRDEEFLAWKEAFKSFLSVSKGCKISIFPFLNSHPVLGSFAGIFKSLLSYKVRSCSGLRGFYKGLRISLWSILDFRISGTVLQQQNVLNDMISCFWDALLASCSGCLQVWCLKCFILATQKKSGCKVPVFLYFLWFWFFSEGRCFYFNTSPIKAKHV